MELLKAVIASFWPQKYRTWGEPEMKASVVHAAVLSGVLEFCIFGYFAFLQFRAHFLALADHFGPGNETTQTAALLVVAASEFFYPLSFVLLFFTLEGFVRALSGAIVGEVLPSFPVALFARLWHRMHHPHSGAIAR
jgi:hypothetical protein